MLKAAFEEKYMDSLVERVLPLWKVKGESAEFNRFYVEMIVRTNMHKNQLQFEKEEEGFLKASAFGTEKKDFFKTEAVHNYEKSDWLSQVLKEFSSREKKIFSNGYKYLLQMEEKTFSLM